VKHAYLVANSNSFSEISSVFVVSFNTLLEIEHFPVNKVSEIKIFSKLTDKIIFAQKTFLAFCFIFSLGTKFFLLLIMKPLSLQGHTRALTRVRINNDGDLLFTASKDHSPCVWYLENGERIGTYQGHTGVIWDIDVSWDSKTLVSSSGDPSVKV
jgi:WD40 repeat protein